MEYKRLTKLSDLGTLHALDFNREEQPLCELTALDIDVLIGRLYELENKIESGEICEREKVKKETAREILQIIKDSVHIHFAMREIAKKYGVELEDEE